jgi:uncharacterized protein YkwD
VRPLRLLLAGLAVAAIAAGPAVSARDDVDRTLARKVVAAINDVRAEHGVRALRPAARLRELATAHATRMAADGFFQHSSAVRHLSTYPVGEVLLWTTGPLSASEAVRRWLASPAHRATLLRRGFERLGVAVVHAAGAPGVFGGRNVTIVVVDFAGGA